MHYRPKYQGISKLGVLIVPDTNLRIFTSNPILLFQIMVLHSHLLKFNTKT